MQRLQAFKFELQPKPAQASAFRRVAGCCRLVFNRALAAQKARHEHDEKYVGYGDLCKELTAWKHEEETAFLAEVHSQPLQQALKDLGRAYTNFFAGRAAFPRFKKRGRRDSFRYPQPKPEHIDQGWFAFRQMLDYKLDWNGGWLVAVNPRNTSRTCGVCGHVDAANRTSQARFQCVACEFEENADLNAARNILRAGHARFACSGPQGPESQTQGSKTHWGLLAGSSPARVMPRISAL